MTGRTLRLAHRGDWRTAPENSLAALLAAMAISGCDGVEFDVRASADGVPVLLHDETLERVQGRPVRVADVTARDLAELGVPTLEVVLAALPGSAFLDVELKGDPGVDRVVEVLESARGPQAEQIAISSFEPTTLATVGATRPSWVRWLNADDLAPATIALARDLGCGAIAAEWQSIDEPAVDAARRAGLVVAAWTVRDLDDLARLERLGVVAACVEGRALGN